MSEEQLRTVTASTIHSLVSSGRICAPITSIDLLTTIISTGTPRGLLDSSPTPSFRLTDLPRFERILEWLSSHWDQGSLSLSRDDNGLTVMDVHLGSGSKLDAAGASGVGPAGKKRKRVVDEDADSAAGSGDEADDSYEEITKPPTALGSLTKELKEVYTVLQKSTARGRLLAEQVRLIMFLNIHSGSLQDWHNFYSSFALSIHSLSPYAHILPSRIASKLVLLPLPQHLLRSVTASISGL